MQAASDIFLGYQPVEGPDGVTRDFYVRQLRDWKGSYEIEKSIPPGLTKYVGVCARPWPGRTPDPVTASPSPAIWERGPRSTGALLTSPKRTPIRISGTTRRSRQAAATGRITVESGL